MVHASSSGNARCICARWRAVAGSENSSTPKPTRTRAMHSRRYACDSPNKNHFRNQQYCLGGYCETLPGQLPFRSRPVLVHLVAVGLAAQVHPPRGSVCADDARHACSLSTSQPNLPSSWMSSADIIISIGVSPRVFVPSTARATHRDHHWFVQWSLEGLLAFRAGRGSACGLPLPHLHRFYANVVDLLLSAGSIAWTASVSQARRRSHLTGRVLAFG